MLGRLGICVILPDFTGFTHNGEIHKGNELTKNEASSTLDSCTCMFKECLYTYVIRPNKKKGKCVSGNGSEMFKECLNT